MSRFFSQIFAWNSSDAMAGSRHRIGKRLNGSRRIVGAFVLAVVLIGQGAHGAIRTVTKNTDNNPSLVANAGELRYEINQAVAADTIVFDPTFFSVPRTILLHPDLYGGLFVTKNLTITGPGPANLIIDAGGISARAFTFGVVTASISGLTITGGKAPQEGGNPLLFIPPQYARGGGIHSSGTLTVSNCWIVGNQATTGPLYAVAASGAGIYSDRGVLTVVDCVISNNTALAASSAGFLAAGGGIYASAPTVLGRPALTLLRSTMAGNRIAGSAASGGGIFQATNVVGIPVSSIINSTISGNTSESLATTGADAGSGGGIYATNIVCLNSTIASNGVVLAGGRPTSAGTGGGLWGAVTLKNTLVAGNGAPTFPDVRGPMVSLGHNLIGATVGFASAAGDLVGTLVSPINPLLGPLQNNGGLTPTHALPPGSPAIDAGDNVGAPTTDQRGLPRPGASSAVDIGAYESGSTPAPLAIQCSPPLQVATIGCATSRTLLIPASLIPPTFSGGSGTPALKVRFEGEVLNYAVPSSLTFPIGITNLVWTYTAGVETASCTQQVTVIEGVNQPPAIALVPPAPTVVALNSSTIVAFNVGDAETPNLSTLIVNSSSGDLVTLNSSGPSTGGSYSLTILAGNVSGDVSITNIVTDVCGASATNRFTVHVGLPPLAIQCSSALQIATIGCATSRTLLIPANLTPPTYSGGSGTPTLKVRFEGEVLDYAVPSSLTFPLGITNLVWTYTAGVETASCTQQVTVTEGVNQPPVFVLLPPTTTPMATGSSRMVTLVVGDAETANPATLNVSSTSGNLVTLLASGPSVSGNYFLTITAGNIPGVATITNIVTDGCGATATNRFTLQVSLPPTISDIPNQTVARGSLVTATVPFRVTGSGTLTLGATIVPPPSVFIPGLGFAQFFVLPTSFAGTGNDRSITVSLSAPAPLPDYPPAYPAIFGATVTVTNDNTLTSGDPFTITIVDSLDTDGIAAAVEDSAPNNGDGNSDGIQDRLQSEVASLPAAVTPASYVTLTAPSGLRFVNVVALAPPAPTLPDVSFPRGLIQFRLEGLPTLGASVMVTQIFQAALPANLTFYKYGSAAPGAAASYYPFMYHPASSPTGAEIIRAENKIILHLKDGALGDDDWIENGVVTDASGPALVSVEPAALSISILSPTQAQISWPVSAGALVLQYTVSFVPPITWQPDNHPTTINGPLKSVTVDLGNGDRFYTLGTP